MDFRGETLLITGGSRGIGRATAAMAAAHGARVVVHYRSNREAAEATQSTLAGGPHHLVQAELGDPDAVKRMMEECLSHVDRLDVVVNNAGTWVEHPIADVGYDEWRSAWARTLDVNLSGPANVCHLAAHHMIERGGGRIVNVSSRGAFRGEPTGPAYAASKAGLNAMSQSLAQALAPHRVAVYVVAPGFVETDMAAEYLGGPTGDAIRAQSPFGRVARAEEIARAILLLAERGGEFMSGTIVDVNGASYLRS